MKDAAVAKTREAFRLNRNETDKDKVGKLLEEAKQYTSFLRTNVMQAQLQKSGAYGKLDFGMVMLMCSQLISELKVQPQHLTPKSGKFGHKYTSS